MINALSVDSKTRNVIDNNIKSNNLLESGIRNIGILKDDQKYDYSIKEGIHKHFLMILRHSEK